MSKTDVIEIEGVVVEKQGLYKEIDGLQPIDKVYADVKVSLGCSK